MVYKLHVQLLKKNYAKPASFGLSSRRYVLGPYWQLAEEWDKTIIWTFIKSKEHSSFKNNIWDGDLADMLLIFIVNMLCKFI